jgi:hypothetical protein
MALHRDIYWVGKQWAVTGYGLQACNQKQKGQFDIEGVRLWEDGALERLRAEAWLNIEDFEKALAVARKHYPEPPRKPAAPAPNVSRLDETRLRPAAPREMAAEASKPATAKFELRIGAWPAKFVRPWRIRIQR